MISILACLRRLISPRSKPNMAEVPTTSQVHTPTTTLWQNRKCLIIACIVATANMQYGFDSAAIGALQAMPGFLKVFGFRTQ